MGLCRLHRRFSIAHHIQTFQIFKNCVVWSCRQDFSKGSERFNILNCNTLSSQEVLQVSLPWDQWRKYRPVLLPREVDAKYRYHLSWVGSTVLYGLVIWWWCWLRFYSAFLSFDLQFFSFWEWVKFLQVCNYHFACIWSSFVKRH